MVTVLFCVVCAAEGKHHDKNSCDVAVSIWKSAALEFSNVWRLTYAKVGLYNLKCD